MESEHNLSFEPGDNAWIYDNAICCNDGYVDRGAILQDEAIVCDDGYISHNAVMKGHSRVEDGPRCAAPSSMTARVSGCAIVRHSTETGHVPILSGHCSVYGNVSGGVRLIGSTVIISGEGIYNDTPDILVINGQSRSVNRDPSRDVLGSRSRRHSRHRNGRKGWSGEQFL